MTIKAKHEIPSNERFGCIDDGNFQGTAVSYAVGPDTRNGFEIISDVCDYDISDLETNPDQTRAAHLRAKRLGKRPKKLPPDAFDGDVLVLVGPRSSPQRVIQALKLIIENIRFAGLVIGRDANGERIREPVERTKIKRARKSSLNKQL